VPGSSRLGQPADTAAKCIVTPAQQRPAAQQAQQQAQQEAGRPKKTAAGEGDAVEVMWQVDGQLVPYVGIVVEVLPEVGMLYCFGGT